MSKMHQQALETADLMIRTTLDLNDALITRVENLEATVAGYRDALNVFKVTHPQAAQDFEVLLQAYAQYHTKGIR